MVAPGQIIYKILTDDTDVSALIDSRVYPPIATNPTGLPYVMYQVISTNHMNNMGGSSGLANTLLQLESYATTYGGAVELAGECRDALHAIRDTLTINGDTVAFTIWLQRTLDDLGAPDTANDTNIYRVVQEYSIWHSESVLDISELPST